MSILRWEKRAADRFYRERRRDALEKLWQALRLQSVWPSAASRRGTLRYVERLLRRMKRMDTGRWYWEGRDGSEAGD